MEGGGCGQPGGVTRTGGTLLGVDGDKSGTSLEVTEVTRVALTGGSCLVRSSSDC
jgi:hypothetical protein